MSNTENLPDKHFREKLENLEVPPSNRVWTGISSHLEHTAIARKRKTNWLWRLGAGALIVSLSAAAAYTIFNDHADQAVNDRPVAQNTVLKPSASSKAGAVSDRHSSADTVELPDNANSRVATASVPPASSNEGVGKENHHKENHYIVSTSKSPASKKKIRVTQSPSSSRTGEGHKSPPQKDEYYNEGSKVKRNEVRHVEPGSEPSITKKEEPQPDPYGKIASRPQIFPVSTRQFRVEPLELASELKELEYEDIPEGQSCPHWTVGVNYLYGITYRKLENNDNAQMTAHPFDSMDRDKLTSSYFDTIENRNMGYVRGLSLGYRVGRFTLRTGIEQSKYQWTANAARGMFSNGAESTFIIPTSMTFYSNDTLGDNYASDYEMTILTQTIEVEDTVKLVHTSKYTTVPFTLSYSFTRPCKKFGVAITGGIAASYYKSYTLTHDGYQQEPATFYIRSRNYQLIAGASVSYAPVHWLSIELQPTYRRFIQPVNRRQSVGTYPYIVGAQGALYFRF